MTGPPLLDTPAWLWWLDGTGNLTARERRALDSLADGSERPYLCAIGLCDDAIRRSGLVRLWKA